METLEIPLTKKKLLPKDFTEAHDISVSKVKIVGSKVLCKKIKQRYNELEKNQYNNDMFFIRPAKTLNDIKDEAKQQNNCVYTNYSESYAWGDTDIYFLRELKSPKKSLVTVEVRNNKIRQKYQRENELVTEEQKNFLNLWEKQVIQKVA